MSDLTPEKVREALRRMNEDEDFRIVEAAAEAWADLIEKAPRVWDCTRDRATPELVAEWPTTPGACSFCGSSAFGCGWVRLVRLEEE